MSRIIFLIVSAFYLCGCSSFFEAKDTANADQADLFNIAVYSIFCGSSPVPGWVSDRDLSQSKYFYTDTQAKWAGAFGLGSSFTSPPAGVRRGTSLPQDLPNEILQTYRTDALTSIDHSPGLIYRFALPVGNYKLRVIYLVSSDQNVFKVSIGNLSNKVIKATKSEYEIAEMDTINFAVTDSSSETKIIFYPEDGYSKLNFIGLQIMSEAEPQFTPSMSNLVRYITPSGAGVADGTSWANAGTLSSLNAYISFLKDNGGGEIHLHSGLGKYNVTSRIELLKTTTSAGEPKVTIRGLNPDNFKEYKRAIIESNRSAPWPEIAMTPTGASTTGSAIFNLRQGMNNLEFKDLEFLNIGGGAIKIADSISNLTISDIHAENCQRVFENLLSGAVPNANINGLVIRYVSAKGYSRNFIRLGYSSSNVLIEDVYGDSQRQVDTSGFSTGVVIEASANSAIIRRATMLNHHDQSNAYWNADGFSAEAANYSIRYEYCLSAGNTDGGYDTKAADTYFLRTVSIDNKKNYRVWNSAVLDQVVSLDPFIRGGSSAQSHLGSYVESLFAGQNKLVTLNGVYMSDSSSSTLVFDTAQYGGTSVRVNSGTIIMSILGTISNGSYALDPAVVLIQK